jgi:energy-coupling factor transporter ATP-binding protein EcfA2
MSLLSPDGSPARWTVVLGENGVGKTTLLQMLALLSVRDSGEVEHRLDYEMFEMFDRYYERRRPPRPGSLSASLRRSGEGGTATATFRRGRVEYKHSILAGQREPSHRGHPIN